ncbi:hypothetical protein [Streptomyces sp. AC555_RSS877]|uniref:hypothetical protein n=1 Tax=Streptomyces sp. AC555_RSS877 TaxID=2823688 RepID=UPI001C2777FC|nr:hypothetical protein [Streptomyces sp. AC555_RSS877]
MDVSIYVDAVDGARVVAWLQGSLNLKDNGPCLAVGPLCVSGEYNGYATGRRAHPFAFLEWPTVLECEASAGAPADVVQAVAAVLEALWRGGFKAVAACDFEDELPARGGADRYPFPPASGRSPASTCSWWRNLISPGKRRSGIL